MRSHLMHPWKCRDLQLAIYNVFILILFIVGMECIWSVNMGLFPFHPGFFLAHFHFLFIPYKVHSPFSYFIDIIMGELWNC